MLKVHYHFVGAFEIKVAEDDSGKVREAGQGYSLLLVELVPLIFLKSPPGTQPHSLLPGRLK